MTATNITRMPLSELAPAPYNPRRISDDALDGLQKSIGRFGLVELIVWNRRTGSVVSGHQRLKALQAAGEVETDVVVVDLELAEEKALNIAMNNPAIAGEFTTDLQQLLVELHQVDEALFADLMLDDLLEEEAPAPATPRETAEPPAVPQRAAQGDVWQLGEHWLYCGDCCQLPQLLSERGEKAALAFTSPPYASQREYDPASGFRPVAPDKYLAWFEPVQQAIADSLDESASYFLNIKEHCDDGQRHLYVKDLTLAHARKWSWRFVDEFAWCRQGVPGRWSNRFKNGWEPIFHFAKARSIRFFPTAVAHESDDVIAYSPDNPRAVSGSGLLSNPGTGTTGMALPSNVLRVPTGGAATSASHSAAFPVALVEFFVKAYSAIGDLVLDPFMGSGTTMIAAHQQQRRSVGAEISAKHCDVIIQRWEQTTGIPARKL